MFRLFGRAKLRPGASPDRYTLTFQIGDRQATLEHSGELGVQTRLRRACCRIFAARR